MKRILIALSLFIAMVISFDRCAAQQVKQDAKGNYYAVKDTTTTASGKPTGQTFTDSKGQQYPVFVSKNGKLFYMRTSKAGNVYKCYLKV